MKQRPRIYWTESQKALVWNRWQTRYSDRRGIELNYRPLPHQII